MAFKWWPVDKMYFNAVKVSNWRTKSQIRDFFKEINQMTPDGCVGNKMSICMLFPPNSDNNNFNFDYYSRFQWTNNNGVTYSKTMGAGFDGATSYLDNFLIQSYYQIGLIPACYPFQPGDVHQSFYLTFIELPPPGNQFTIWGSSDTVSGFQLSCAVAQ